MLREASAEQLKTFENIEQLKSEFKEEVPLTFHLIGNFTYTLIVKLQNTEVKL